MDREKVCGQLMELFILAVNKYNALEKMPLTISRRHNLYHSERHILDKIGAYPGLNITDFAKALGVTKGAVSQIVKKLENKGVIRRYKSSDNDKEVFLKLTPVGREIYRKHEKTNEETIRPLIAELKKYPDDKIDFLITMFTWIGEYLDRGGKQTKDHK
ncbi:MAG: MarR family transcriptional regulator [Dissulfurispiraceae bacterium]